MRCIQLSYDIPVEVDIVNPTAQLRQYGFRYQGSCWIIPEDHIPWNLIKEYTDAGCKMDFFRIDASETPSMIRRAIVAIETSIREQLESSQATMEGGFARHTTRVVADGLEQNPEARRDAVNRYKVNERGAVREMKNLLESVEACAQKFGIDPASLSIADTRRVFAGLRVGMEARVNAYAAMTQRLRETAAAGNETAAAVVAQAEANTLPAYVGSDILQEAGDEATAVSINTAFGEGEPVGAAVGGDDGTFSLADLGDE